MSIASTINKLEKLKLHGMVRALNGAMEVGIASLSNEELLAHIVDAEWEYRHNRKLAKLIKAAKFRYSASIEEINFSIKRNFDKNCLLPFSDCSWIEKKQNIIITGPTGVGKSYVSAAIGHQACIYGFKTSYFNFGKLIPALKLKKADGSYAKEIRRIEKQDVLVLDDFGLEKLDTVSRLILLEILEDRHGIRSTIITSQLPVAAWHDVIGDPTISDAICDRIVHNCHRIELDGPSARKTYGNL